MNDSAARRAEIRRYAIGYALALILSLGAFAALYFRIASPTAILETILALALLQAVVHFRFFLDVSFARSRRDNLVLLLFSASIIALMSAGTLVILFNLRGRMM